MSKSSRTSRRRRGVGRLFVYTVAFAITATLFGGGYAWHSYRSLCGTPCVDLSPLENFRPDEGSTILDRYGNEIGMLYRKNRRVIGVSDLPAHVPGAFIAVEDQRFFEHSGVDFWRVGGAIIANIKARGVAEGFSTITMQLARNVFPEALPYTQQTLQRKLTEVRVARDIEARFTKKEILDFYLNTIYFGAGAYGVDAAARTYFDKPAADLTVSEAALLAGLPKAPSRYNPYTKKERAIGRRNVVLNLMVASGAIDSATYRNALADTLTLAHGNTREALEAATSTAPYFVEEIRQRLEARFGAELYRGGLRIHTTLDTTFQRIAETELEAQLRRIEHDSLGTFRGEVRDTARKWKEGTRPTYLQGSVVVMDPTSGDVLALVGGRNFEESKFNRVTQALRQPGSSFKPIVYTAAIQAGLSPHDSVSDGPITVRLQTGETWTPANFSEDTTATTPMLTIASALQKSRNRAAVRVALLTGLDSVAAVAKAMGIEQEMPPYPSISLGSVDLTMLELAKAYTSLARTDGHHVEPRFITRVEDRTGRILLSNAPVAAPSIDPVGAAIVREMMRGVVDHGTATSVRRAGYTGPAAGKTGTTNGHTDAWFVGFTPEAVAAVWVGFDEPKRILSGKAATGGSLAAPVWGRIMAQAPLDSLRVASVAADTLSLAPDDSTFTDAPTYTDRPWSVPTRIWEFVERGRLIDGCPDVRHVDAPYWGGPVMPDTLSAPDTPSAPETGIQNDPSPLDLLARVLDRFRGRQSAQPHHYICVNALLAPADSTAEDEHADTDDLPILERLRRRLTPGGTDSH